MFQTSTPNCSDGEKAAVVCGIYSIPDDKTNFIYLLKIQDTESGQKGMGDHTKFISCSFVMGNLCERELQTTLLL